MIHSKKSIVINSKLPKVGTTIFSIMSALANEQNAINLSQGFPGFEPSKKLLDHVTEGMHKGFNQYAPMAGLISLREKLAEKMESLYNVNLNPETEITITAGATQAIYTAISAFVKEGDEVIIFTPAYDCYEPAIEVNGGNVITVKLHGPDFKVDWNRVQKLITQKCKMIIINTPHNPTGKIWSEEDLLKLQKITDDTNIVVLSDEVYEHIVFDKKQHQSVLRFPKLAERSLAVFSFGKTYHNTGWKVGYCVASKEIMSEFRKVHQYNVFCVNSVMQYAFSQILDEKNLYLELNNFYQEKRDFFAKAIQSSRFDIIPCEGTYFQLLGYNSITEENDVDFARRLTIENKVASIPVSVFYSTPTPANLLRFCFAKDNETLEKAAEIINKV
jgi:methionine aminotransferase